MRIVSGKYGRRRFDVPSNITARPTTDMARENLFNVLGNLIDYEGKSALDLFAGTGAIGFEFASRGCEKVVCVEKAATQFKFINKVKGLLHASEMNVLLTDALRYIKTGKDKFDIIFADPPYDMAELAVLPQMILESGLTKPGTLVIVEHPKAFDFSAIPQLVQHRIYGKVNFSIFEA